MMLAGEVQLPYPMQMGSGSYEFRPSVVYRQVLFDHVGVGIQGSAKIRLNENDNRYRLGEEYEVTAWSAVEVLEFMSASFRLAWQQSFNISGRDPKILTNSMMPMLMGMLMRTHWPMGRAIKSSRRSHAIRNRWWRSREW